MLIIAKLRPFFKRLLHHYMLAIYGTQTIRNSNFSLDSLTIVFFSSAVKGVLRYRDCMFLVIAQHSSVTIEDIAALDILN